MRRACVSDLECADSAAAAWFMQEEQQPSPCALAMHFPPSLSARHQLNKVPNPLAALWFFSPLTLSTRAFSSTL